MRSVRALTRQHLHQPRHHLPSLSHTPSSPLTPCSRPSHKPIPQHRPCSSSARKNHIISIDRSNLYTPDKRASQTSQDGVTLSPLLREVRTSIELRGPITVAEYMSTALGHPRHGYYKTRQVFGESGDFTTSPEISQVFGELVGVWCIAQWEALGRPEQVRIVELGPGRGTLMSDLVRACSKFGSFVNAVRNGGGIALVETSPALAEVQAKRLLDAVELEVDVDPMTQVRMPRKGMVQGMEDVPVRWMTQFQQLDVDEEDKDVPVIVIAQELFDALPVHQFEVAEDGTWRERLVDINHGEYGEEETYAVATREKERLDLRFVLSNGGTPASKVLIPSQFAPRTKEAQVEYQPPSPGDRLEVSAAAAALIQDITRRIGTTSGACLIIDYGNNAPAGDTLRGIKEHRFVHPLSEPGDVDLSVDVDFSLLCRIAENEAVPGLVIDGPISQGEFLRNLGIEYRMSALLQRTEDEKTQFDLFDAYQRLVESEQVVNGGMGESYKVLSLTCSRSRTPTMSKAPGFSPLQ